MRRASSIPRVAIVGRQNVGKSTLVNRLFGRRETIAHGSPGVTRDRIEVRDDMAWPHVRPGGHGRLRAPARAGSRPPRATQADRAIADADVIVLVVDAPAGIAEEDAALARRLRRATVPVLLVANKVDTDEDETDAAAFFRLGLGEPFPVSGLHGRATGDLLDRLVALLPDAPARARGHGRPSRGSRSWAVPTSGSRACSTAWWGRSGRSCSKRRARRATPWTPS